MPTHVIKLQETPSPHMLEKRPRYLVLLNGEEVGELYYNMTGYVGSLPTVQGSAMNIGEKSISAWKREAAILNKEAKAAIGSGAVDDRRIGLTRPTSDNRMIFAMSFVKGDAARHHLIARREYIKARKMFGRSDIGIGFFNEHAFARGADDMPQVLLTGQDAPIAATLPVDTFRVMDPLEAERHDRAIDEIHATDDPEKMVVIGRRTIDDADAEPFFVTRQSLDFGKMILGDQLRIGDLEMVDRVSVSDPVIRSALRGDFPWLRLDGGDPQDHKLRDHVQERDAVSGGERPEKSRDEPADDDRMLAGPEA